MNTVILIIVLLTNGSITDHIYANGKSMVNCNKEAKEVMTGTKLEKDEVIKAYCIDTTNGEIRPITGVQLRAN